MVVVTVVFPLKLIMVVILVFLIENPKVVVWLVKVLTIVTDVCRWVSPGGYQGERDQHQDTTSKDMEESLQGKVMYLTVANRHNGANTKYIIQ